MQGRLCQTRYHVLHTCKLKTLFCGIYSAMHLNEKINRMKKLIHTLKRHIVTAIVIIINTSFLYGSSGEIKGKVLDKITGEPLFLATAQVELNGTPFGATTDADGKFTLKPLPAGIYDLTVSYVGMKKYVLENVRVTSNKITFLGNILLEGITIEGAVVTAERYSDKERLIKIEDPTSHTMLYEQFKQNPLNKQPIDMIASSGIPGIYQADPGQPVYFKGSRKDAVLYYVDGIKSPDGGLHIPGLAIGEMTVYTGGVPAMYGDLTGGVVVIETKSYFELLAQRKKYEK
jgi:hypothetical protein